MSSEFSVDLDQLDQIISRLNGLSGFLQDHLDQLDRKVASLSGGGWESAAANAYTNAHTQWASSAREFADGVAELRDAVHKAHGRYSRAIDVNRRMLQSGQA
jgi:WXG100 family type VII secretion target